MSEIKEIRLGTGALYLLEYTGSIPTDPQLELESNRAGYLQSGTSLKYSPTTKQIVNVEGDLEAELITKEVVTLKAQLITWSLGTLEKLIRTSERTDNTITAGGLAKEVDTLYIARFVSNDQKRRITLIGYPTATIEMQNQKNNATTLAFEITAKLVDGKLFTFEDLGDDPVPEYTLDINENGTYEVSSYTYANVNVTPETEGTAEEAQVLADYTFMNAAGGPYTGTMNNYVGITQSVLAYPESSTLLNITVPNNGYYEKYNSILTLSNSPVFGLAHASEVLQGKTFTSSDGYNLVGTFDPGSSATGNATSAQVLSGYTFSNSTGTDLTGTMNYYPESDWWPAAAAVWGPAGSINVILTRIGNSGFYNNNVYLYRDAKVYGNATADKVAAGYTFTSDSGLNIVGTGSGGGSATGNATSAQVLSGYTFSNSTGTDLVGSMNYIPAANWVPGNGVSFSHSTQPNSILVNVKDSGYYESGANLWVDAPLFGNAAASQVLAGRTFTSLNGVNLMGTYSAPYTGRLTFTSVTSQFISCGFQPMAVFWWKEGMLGAVDNTSSGYLYNNAAAANKFTGVEFYKAPSYSLAAVATQQMVGGRIPSFNSEGFEFKPRYVGNYHVIALPTSLMPPTVSMGSPE